ncbi:MAG: hypothetical protein C4527_29125 [Candidatus Omnitrophota bacterium]|jgi:hypothetical protein|nr:MAG: hypothetical protein C4527_29125 [Candidatus Omnitrophota bacterium]
MNEQRKSIFAIIFEFLASLKLAVILLVIFAAMLSWATFYESSTSTEAAQRLIYKTLWFDLYLFLLGVNVTCSALKRFPWKKHHIGFVITHTGIIIILLGSLVTRKFGVEGTLALLEGESADSIRLEDIVLSVTAPRLHVREDLNPWFIQDGIPQNKEIQYAIGDSGITCYVDRYFFNPRTVENVISDPQSGNPAVCILFTQAGDSSSMAPQWLMLDQPGRESLDLGIAKVLFERIPTQEALLERLNPPEIKPDLSADDPQGEILLKDAQNNVIQTIPLKHLTAMPHTFAYNNAQFIVKLIEFVPRAGIHDGKLVNHESGKLNPAVKYELHGPQGVENHLAFSLFPDLGSSHGKNESLSGLQGQFNYPIKDSSVSENLVTIFLGPSGNLFYRAANLAGQLASGEIKKGDSFDTTWNNIHMTVVDFIPTAQITHDIVEGGRAMGMHNDPIVRIRLEYKGETAEEYARFGVPVSMTVGGETCTVEFGPRKFPLGFTLQLIDFNAPNYPGTNRPARFESDVMLIDPDNNINEQRKIYMNNPLAYNHFLVYQSSYQKGRNGEPDQSIFSVARAPGTPIIYFGSIVLTIGMIIMFVSKKRNFMQAPPSESF